MQLSIDHDFFESSLQNIIFGRSIEQKNYVIIVISATDHSLVAIKGKHYISRAQVRQPAITKLFTSPSSNLNEKVSTTQDIYPIFYL